MQYQQVCLEGLAYTLPDERVTSDEIEARLAPLYDRLRLPAGRLELMTGIRERGFGLSARCPVRKASKVASASWRVAKSIAARSALGSCLGLSRSSRTGDRLPRASRAGIAAGVSDLRHVECMFGDPQRNAGRGQYDRVGSDPRRLVVGSEGSRQLVETTIDWLNRDQSLTARA